MRREHKKIPEAKGTAQKRKEQVDEKRAALGRRPCEPCPNRICYSGMGGPGLTVGGGDRDFIPGLEVQSPFLD